MASVRKIASNTSRDIDFSKLVLRQSNVRRAKARRQCHDGPNSFASLDFLNRPDELAGRIKAACRI